MKLAPLLAGYLFSQHRLDLPGLGSFRLDPSNEKPEGSDLPQAVSFESNPAIAQSPGLVEFISAETGKMKALAAADLNSHLELAHQFLNIGKPFLFEGIGSLVKQRNKEYVFTPGPVMPESVPQKEKQANDTVKEESSIDYKKIFYGRKLRPSGMKAATFLLATLGLGVAILGGYSIYKKSSGNNSIPRVETTLPEEPATANAIRFTSTHEAATDTTYTPPAPKVQKQKFVLETANAKRAFARYNRLKSFQWNVEMETEDSVQYKLYVMIPAPIVDTIRIIDSLTRMNGRRVYME